MRDPALRRARQGDSKFKGSLEITVWYCPRVEEQKEKERGRKWKSRYEYGL